MRNLVEKGPELIPRYRKGVRIKMVNFTEKRKFKRLGLSIPVKLRQALSDGKEKTSNCVSSNISYGGVYIKDINAAGVTPGDSLGISILIPRVFAKDFPFSRITGKAKVVRAEGNSAALEFNRDIHRLCIAA